MQDQRVSDLMIKVADMKVSTFYFFREQTHPGRCIVAFNKGHKGEVFHLSDQEQKDFMDDLVKAAAAVQEVFSPDKINYASFGDGVPHLHFHVVPKYKDGAKWCGIFDMMPEEKVFLSDGEYEDAVARLKAAL
jgi:diadenosine tetraphosphate (Ap4A) HIT family hydrolase